MAEVEVTGFGVATLPRIIDDEDNLFAFQVVAGVGIAVGKRWKVGMVSGRDVARPQATAPVP